MSKFCRDCCKKPSVANLDHKKGFEPEVVNMVNRVCLNCKTHWYGPEGDVSEFTSKQWGEWIGDAFGDTYIHAEATP